MITKTTSPLYARLLIMRIKKKYWPYIDSIDKEPERNHITLNTGDIGLVGATFFLLVNSIGLNDSKSFPQVFRQIRVIQKG